MLKPCRRRERSNDLQTALRLQLEYCVELFKLDAMTLADRSGMVLASTDEETGVGEVLAAFAPLLSRNRFQDNRPRIMASLHRHMGASSGPVAVRRFQIQGEELYMCTLGGLGARSELALHRAVNGARRILGILP